MVNNLFAGKRVLITGGVGFIGSNLAQALVRLKAKVLIIDSCVDQGELSMYIFLKNIR
jgi:nucleoside-diphosphate-sugar epimerase